MGMAEKNDSAARAEVAVIKERTCQQVPIGRKGMKTGVGVSMHSSIQQRSRVVLRWGIKGTSTATLMQNLVYAAPHTSAAFMGIFHV